jgi:putative DNA primase/helicase
MSNTMSAAAIARALGGSGLSRNGWFACDCPGCKGQGKLGLRDADTGLAVNCFKLCRRTDILAELGRLGVLGSTPSRPDPGQAARRQAREQADNRRRIAEARDFIAECLPWDTTNQIAAYVRSRELDPALLTRSIMWHGVSRHPEGGQRPLMVGVIEHVELGVIGASRTYLATDGSQKATFTKPRLFLGLASGGGVWLGDVSNNGELVVGEGLESTLSYMQLHNLPGGVSALSASGIANLILPREARFIVIAADNDKNQVGWRASVAAARRWGGEMRRARIDMPPVPGTDWNDVLVARTKVAA